MVFDKVREIVANQLDLDPASITMDSALVDDLKADSLDIVELIMGIEDEFDIEIPDEDAEKLTTVGEAINYAAAKLGIEE